MCVCVCVCVYPTPPHEQDTTQGQIFRQNFFFQDLLSFQG